MPSDEWYREQATKEYGSDEVEVDGTATVSRGEGGGAFVAAWVWVSNPE